MGIDHEIMAVAWYASRIISFRNRLIHGYATIADEVVWGVLETNLPCLPARLWICWKNLMIRHNCVLIAYHIANSFLIDERKRQSNFDPP